MSDPADASRHGMETALSGYATAAKSMQDFAQEMQRMSKESFDSTSQLMEKLRAAKTVEEIVSIQTSFMQQSFASYAEHSRRFSELMMALPMEFAKQGRSAFQQGMDTMTKGVDQTGQQVQHAADEINTQHG